MALAGIEVRVGATSNIAAIQRDVAQLQKTVVAANQMQAKMMKNLSLQGAGFNANEFDELQGKLANARSEINKVIQASGRYYMTTRNLTTATADFNDRLARQKVRFSEIWGPKNHKMIREAMKEQMALHNMVVKTYGRSGSQVDADIFMPNPAALTNTRNLRKEIGYLAQAYSSVAVQVTNWGKNIQWAGRQLTVGFSVPLTIALGGLSRLAYGLDEQLVRIEKVYGDGEAMAQATNESIRKMATDTARHVASEWGIAGQATLDVMAELAATGLEGPNLQAMTIQTQRAAILGDLSAEESLKLIRTLKEAYRQNNEEIEHSVNLFNEIENSTALTMNDISEGLPRVAGILQATGVSMADTLVLLTAFKEAGVDVAEGATALKSINFKAIAATPTAAKNFLEITGRDINEIVDAANGEFLPVMMEIANIMQTLSQQDRTNLIARVFGIHQGSRAITLLEQLANGSAGMQRAMDAAGKSAEQLAETADSELEALQNSLSTRLNRVKESLLITFGELGTVALEMLMPWIERFAGFVDWLGSLPEWIKKLGIGSAIGLTIVGPLVMLVGLFANLIGMTGRAALAIVKLLAPFKILTMESKAAQLMQQAFGSSTDRATEAILRQVNALELQNGMLAKTESILRANMGATSGAVGMTPAMAGAYGQYRSSTPNPLSPSMWVVQQAAIGGVTAETEKATKATSRFGSQWMKASGSISVAAGTVGMLSSMIGNELVSNTSMAVMALTGIAPMFGSMFKRVNTSITSAAATATGAVGTVARGASSAIGTVVSTGSKLIGGLLSPVGLALGATIALGTWAWNNHRKEMERVKKVYEDVRNSSEALAEAYDYIATESLKQEMVEDGTWDEDTVRAQDARLKEMRDNDAEILKLMSDYAAEINKNYEGADRRIQFVNEAMRQGQRVMAETGDSALAWRAAWDTFTMMSGERIGLDAFKQNIVFEFGGWDEDSLDDAISVAEQTLARLSTKTGGNGVTAGGIQIGVKMVVTEQDLNEVEEGFYTAMGGGGVNVPVSYEVSEEERNRLRTELKTLFETLNSAGLTPAETYDIFAQLNPITDKWRLQYEEWQKYTGDSTTTFIEFMQNIEAESRRMGTFSILEPQDVAVAREMFPIMHELNGESMEYIGTHKDGIFYVSGYRASIEELITAEEKLAIQRKAMQFVNYEEVYEEELMKLGRAKIAAAAVEGELKRVGGAIAEIGNAAGIQDLGDDLEDTKDKANELQDAMIAGRRDANEYFANALADEYMKEFDKYQERERQAVRDRHDAEIEAIEETYDRREKALDARQDKEMEALDARRKRENEALDKQFERERDALDKRQKAANDALSDRQDADTKRMEERHERESEALEKRQEARRKRIEEAFEQRIQFIRDEIEAEREAERRRQEIFEREKERISRLANMFNRNIDFNMAINSGDLDQAAKIANEMAAQTQQWGLDDAAEISQTASEKRIAELEKSIDAIEEERDARLEAIKEVEKAEDKARKDKEKAEKEHLKRLHQQQNEALRERQKMEDRALRDDQKLRQEALDARFEAYRKTLEAEHQKQNESLAQRRTDAIEEQRKLNEADMAAVDERLAYAKEALEMELEARIALTPRTKAEQDKLHRDLQKMFGTHMDTNVRISDGRVNQIMENTEKRVDRTLNEYVDDKNWANMSAKIAKKMAKGVFGTDVSLKELREFILYGKIPGGAKSATPKDVDVWPYAKHSGGVVGESGSSRVGYSGKTYSFSEMPVNMLRGEGVLNLRAMRTPGMKEFLADANSGRISYAPGTGDGMGMGFAAVLGTMRQVQRGMADQITMRGLERGAQVNALSGGFAASLQGGRLSAGLAPEQISNAQLIMAVGRTMAGITERDIMIGIMTAMQESSLRNINYGDRDSLGLFQQRPSQGWGTPSQIMNPDYAIRKFFSELLKVNDRQNLATWQVADAVQRSAFPFAYAQHEGLARELMGLNLDLPDVTKVGATARMEAISKAVQEAIEREDFNLSGVPPAGGRFSGNGIGWEKMWRIVNQNIPHAILSSAYRGRRNTASGLRSYHNVGRAIDIVSSLGPQGMMEIFNFLRSKYGSKNHELYYSPARGRQVLQGRPYDTYGTAAYFNHFDHVHWAMKNGGLVPGMGIGDIVPSMLEPKEFVVNRKATDTFLPLLQAINSGEWSGSSVSGIDSGSGSVYNVEVNFNGPVSSELDIEGAVRKTFNKIARENERRRGGRRKL